MAILKSKLPPLYHSFFPAFIETEIPDEKWATCDDCLLCRSPKSPNIDVKCCDYYPHLANYLVGGILQDTRPEMATGRSRIRSLIQHKTGIIPHGIIPSSAYKTQRNKNLYEQASIPKSNARLRKETLDSRCPYLDNGNCSIWDYRESLCSTHFCTSTGGKDGIRFWNATHDYLTMTEDILSNYVLSELGITSSSLPVDSLKTIDFNLEKSNGLINEEYYRQLWKNWVGAEEEFYIRCYEIVASLDEKTFIELTGRRQGILAHAIEQSLDTFNDNIIPEYLQLHPALVVRQDSSDACTLILNQQSTRVNPIIYTYLKLFNGKRTTTDIINLASRLMIQLGLQIYDLVQKEILIPVTLLTDQR